MTNSTLQKMKVLVSSLGNALSYGKHVFLLILMFALSGTAIASVDVYVGENYSYNNYLPTTGSYNYSLTQQIYTAEQIGMSGTINEISFYTSNVNRTRVLNVFMIETDKDAFVDYNDFVYLTNPDTLFSGSVTFLPNRWNAIVLDKPFEYSGEHNLLICVQDVTGSNTGSGSLRNYVFPEYEYIEDQGWVYHYRAIYRYSNFSTPIPVDEAPTIYSSGDRYFYKNYLKIGITPHTTLTANNVLFNYNRPNGYWSEEEKSVTIHNTGHDGVITNITFTDPLFVINEAFGDTIHENEDLVYQVTTTSGEEGYNEFKGIVFYTDDLGEAKFDTLFIASATMYDVTQDGDVYETANEVEFDTLLQFKQLIDATDLHHTYNFYTINNNYKDYVYKVTFPQDVLLSAGNRGWNAHTAIYADGFNGEGGPKAGNQYVSPDELNYRGWEAESINEGFEKGHFDHQDTITWTNNPDGQGFGFMIVNDPDLARTGNYCIKSTNEGVTGSTASIQLSAITGNGGFFFSYKSYNSDAKVIFNDQEFNLENTYGTWYTFGCNVQHEATVVKFVNTAYGDDDILYIDDIIIPVPYYVYDDPVYQINNMTVQAGTYYVVTTAYDDEFQFNMEYDTVPAVTDAPVIYNPFDYQTNINDEATMNWSLGQYTTEMQVRLGTNKNNISIVTPWTTELTTSYALDSLEHNKLYYAVVEARNSSATTALKSDTLHFYTVLDNVENFTAVNDSIYDYDAAVLTWDANADVAGYLIWQDAVLLNELDTLYNPILITGSTYTVDSLEYSMEGHLFEIQAQYDLYDGAVSDVESTIVYVAGRGTVSGTVYEQDGITPIEGATITFHGLNEYLDTLTMTATTDTLGAYELQIPAGLYEAVASKDEYQDAEFESLIGIGNRIETEGIDFILDEVFNGVSNITYQEMLGGMKVSWTFEGGVHPSGGGGSLPTDVIYTLVTDASQLTEGDQIIIVGYSGDNAKLMGKQNNNNRLAVDGQVVNNTIINPVIAETNDDTEHPFAFTLGTVTGGKWTLYDAVNEGYLYAASKSSNYMRIQTTNDANGQWTITVATDGSATVKSNGANTRNWMRKNSNNDLFSCYKNGQDNIYLYRLPAESTAKGNRTAQYYRLYRANVAYDQVDTLLIADGLTTESYLDKDWLTIEDGDYMYGVGVVYEGNHVIPEDRSGAPVSFFTENFDNGLPTDWVAKDADGDGQTWFAGSEIGLTGMGGEGDMMVSRSYYDGQSLTTADNYLITPYVQITETSVFSFYAQAQDEYYPEEHFAVCFSTDGETFQTVESWTNPNIAPNRGQGPWTYFMTSLADFAGQKGYIAIRHFGNGNNTFQLNVDNAKLTNNTIFTERENIAWGDTISKDMTVANLKVTVTLDGDAPTGTQVVFINTNEYEQAMYPVDTLTMTATGIHTYATFRKGIYNIQVIREGYETINVVEKILEDNIELEYNLEEAPASFTISISYTGWVRLSGDGNDLPLLNPVVEPEEEANRSFIEAEWELHYRNTDSIVASGTTTNKYLQLPMEILDFYDYDMPYADRAYYRLYITKTYSSGDENSMVASTYFYYYEWAECSNYSYLDAEYFVATAVDNGYLLKWNNSYSSSLNTLIYRDGEPLGYYETEYGYNAYVDEVEGEHTYSIRMMDSYYEMTCEMESADIAATQAIELNAGWNWVANYIEMADTLGGVNGLALLEEGMGTNGVIIKNNTSYVQYAEGEWDGSLEALNNEQMFLVNTTADATVEVAGIKAIASEHPITLAHGWNYLGFVSPDRMPVNNAFQYLNAGWGDVVKTQYGYAYYYGEWFGSLDVLEPGEGMMYYSNATWDKTFRYPNFNFYPVEDPEEEAVMDTENHWTANAGAYQGNMTVMAVVEIDNAMANSDSYELAAFVNGECRGSVKLTYVDVINQYVAFLTVAGDNAAEMNFGIYDAETDEQSFDCNTTLTFSNNAMVGDFDNPFVVSFRGFTGVGESNNTINVYPNPVARGQQVRIDMQTENEVTIEVMNALGQMVYVTTTAQMPASITMPETSGVYTVRVVNNGNIVNHTTIVVK